MAKIGPLTFTDIYWKLQGCQGTCRTHVIHAAFISMPVISWQQLTLFMSFLGFTSTRLELWSVLPKNTTMKIRRILCGLNKGIPRLRVKPLSHTGFLHYKKQLSEIILKSIPKCRSSGLDKSGRTNICMHVWIHTHNVTNMPASGLNEKMKM